MMSRQAGLGVLIAMAGLCAAPAATDAATGPASTYKVTVTKFELYNGTSWVTVSTGNSTVIDIAAVNAGQAAGTFFSSLSVPDGSYTQVRVTPSDTFTVSAGCDKHFATCQAKFANTVNFRGFPHMPGNDFVTAIARPGDPANDGDALA